LAACQRKRLRFLRFSFTQRTQRKRLRLNGNRASPSQHVWSSGLLCCWSNGLEHVSQRPPGSDTKHRQFLYFVENCIIYELVCIRGSATIDIWHWHHYAYQFLHSCPSITQPLTLWLASVIYIYIYGLFYYLSVSFNLEVSVVSL